VQRHFRDLGWSVRPPRRVQDLQWRLTRALDALGQRLGREPSRAELVAELEVPSEAIDEAMAAYGAYAPTSLDQPNSEGSTVSLGELIPGEQPEADASEARMVLAPVVRRLTERDRRILFLRYVEDRTQAEIGEDLGVTQMQVSRLLSRILADLRDQLT
jgi:RNA polymerase sigma-B factor